MSVRRVWVAAKHDGAEPVAMSQLSLLAPSPRNECVFSPCRRYRYLLKRVINPLATKGICLWVMANPSIADEFRLDPTLTRCADYTTRWGFAEMRVVNVRAWVETESDKIPADPLAIGPDNFEHVVQQAVEATLVVCGWGKLGGELGRKTLDAIRPFAVPHALKLNADGSPQHPLYLKASLQPFPMVAG